MNRHAQEGKTISQPNQCTGFGNTQENAIYVRKLMHTPLKLFGKRVGSSLGLGWSTKGFCILQQWDL